MLSMIMRDNRAHHPEVINFLCVFFGKTGDQAPPSERAVSFKISDREVRAV